MLSTLQQPEVFIPLITVLGLLVISGFFSGSETALTAASRARIRSAESDGDTRAGIVSRLLESRERLIGALLLGNNMVNIGASVLMAGLMVDLFGDSAQSKALATAVMTVLILIFAEVLPKTFAITRPEQASLIVARPVGLIVSIFAPVVHVVQIIVNSVLRICGVKPDTQSWTAVEEIRGAVDLHHMEGAVAKRQRDQILGVLDLDDLTVESVMVHRKNLCMIDADASPEMIIKDVLASGHTRLPVWQGDQDNVIGVMHIKDMLKALNRSDGDISALDVRKIAREAWFVPETTQVLAQLKAFQHKREHFALTVDEYGSLMGVVTLEDILEEIVGDIQDEHDEDLEGMRRFKNGSVHVRGDTPVRDLNRALDWNLPDVEAVTVAGVLIHESQTIPEEGQKFAFHGYRFEILEKQRNQIKLLKISPVPTDFNLMGK